MRDYLWTVLCCMHNISKAYSCTILIPSLFFKAFVMCVIDIVCRAMAEVRC